MEIEIRCEEASEVHGVICKHGKMPNGELRFRLQKNDSTAYIRTEASETGGWQQAHWHKKVLETYIVQAGWMAYAELVDDEVRLTTFEPGESFTTEPNVIHNIYLPAEAVIHTVKHGNGRGEVRVVDAKTAEFTSLTETIDEDEIRARANGKTLPKHSEPSSIYSDDYKHFDNLIWQSSAWASGLFTIGLAGLTQIDADHLVRVPVGLPTATLAGLFCLAFGAFVMVISHALYRFRWHQCRTRKRPSVRWVRPNSGFRQW